LARVDHWIGMAQGVSLRLKSGSAPFAHNTMNIEASFTRIQYDITHSDTRRQRETNGQEVARTNEGNHAAAPGNESHCAELAESFRHQIHLDFLPSLQGGVSY
jgi:hypothetical protein